MKHSDSKRETAENRRRQILAAAIKVFSTKGFVKATNKDIAEEAGIQSPGLIYHYFESKGALLKSAIEFYAPPIQLALKPDALFDMAPAEGLTFFARTYFRILDDPNVAACLRILVGEALRHPDFAKLLGDAGPLRLWRLIAAFLQRKVDEGAICCDDTENAAWAFLGSLFVHVFTRRVVGIAPPEIDVEQIVKTNVALFMTGLSVQDD